jgi:hypothetical protein
MVYIHELLDISGAAVRTIPEFCLKRFSAGWAGCRALDACGLRWGGAGNRALADGAVEGLRAGFNLEKRDEK